ncbi:MAG: sugar ABC transporter ATP-binding protein [Cardiobacteriaceae bacterium]|nr:sugar ABC transporter ATP-binding protein [Cardiobacteriaceae bacterium]
METTLPTPPLVEVQGVVKRFGKTTALNGVELTVHAGRTHALVGRNGAGKSTLVSILTGLNTPDEGRVLFGGSPAPEVGDVQAWREKVACVYQKPTIFPNLTVAENLLINRQDFGKRFVSWKQVHQEAQKILDAWDIPVDVRLEAGLLDVENRQLVEIARSLSYGARFIILDEPTAMLEGKAITRLFDRMRKLQEQGVTFLFISHHLTEVYDICHDVTVYRDAKHIVTAPVKDFNQKQMIEAMTGERYEDKVYTPRELPDERVFEVRDLSHQHRFKHLNFAIKKREMVGLVGVGGCGKVGFAETIVGLQSALGGEIYVNGKTYARDSVRAALDAGIGFVPQDRHHGGFVPEMSIEENATMTILPQLSSSKLGIIDRKKRFALANDWIQALDVKTYGAEQEVSGLSGGNQQKVVQARAMANEPQMLVMINPTAGVDIKSKHTLLDYVAKEAERREMAVLIVSDDLDDVRGCDRVVVMQHGEMVHEFKQGWKDNELIAAMEGMLEKEEAPYHFSPQVENV